MKYSIINSSFSSSFLITFETILKEKNLDFDEKLNTQQQQKILQYIRDNDFEISVSASVDHLSCYYYIA